MCIWSRKQIWSFSVTVFCYLFNFIVCFGMICKLGTSVGSTFGLSILFAALFIPLSFLTWYRMLYNAVRYVQCIVYNVYIRHCTMYSILHSYTIYIIHLLYIVHCTLTFKIILSYVKFHNLACKFIQIWYNLAGKFIQVWYNLAGKLIQNLDMISFLLKLMWWKIF